MSAIQGVGKLFGMSSDQKPRLLLPAAEAA
jgi:hypothetical protein